jgi:hypothetical protein
MKRQHFVLLVVLLAVLGGGALVLLRNTQGSWKQSDAGTGQKVLGDFDVNAVGQLVVVQSTNTVTLARTDAGWVVKERGDYPANFDEIRDAIRKLAELKVVQTTQVGPSQRPRLDLAEPAAETGAGLKVELRDASGKELKSLLLGKRVMKQGGQPSPFGGDDGYPVGRYVLALPAGEQVAVVSDTLDSLAPEPSRWLNKDFVAIEKIRSIERVAPEAANSWTLQRETESAPWTLANATPEESPDNNKIAGVTGAFGGANFNDVLVGHSPEQSGLDQPSSVKFATFDGFTYELKIGRLLDDAYPLTVAVSGSFAASRTPGTDEKPEDQETLDREFAGQLAKLNEKLKKEQAFAGRIFLVSKWTVEALLKNRSELLEAKAEPSVGSPE